MELTKEFMTKTLLEILKNLKVAHEKMEQALKPEK